MEHRPSCEHVSKYNYDCPVWYFGRGCYQVCGQPNRAHNNCMLL